MAKSCKKHLDLLEYSIARTCYPSFWLKKGTNYPQITELKSTNYGKIIYILRNFQEILCNSTNYLYLCTHIIQAYKDMTDFKYKPRIADPILRKKNERTCLQDACSKINELTVFIQYRLFHIFKKL